MAMSGANGRDGGSDQGSSAGIGGQSGLGGSSFGGTSTGWGGGGTTSGRESTGFTGGFTGSDWGSSNFGSSNESASKAVSAFASTQQAIAPTVSRFNEVASSRYANTRGLPSSPVSSVGIASSSPSNIGEQGLANTNYSSMMNRNDMVRGITSDTNRHVDSGLAKFGNFLASAVAPPLGTAISVGRAGLGAYNTTQAQQSVAQSLGEKGQTTAQGMASNLAAPVGGFVGGRAGGLIGGQIGFGMGGLPGAVMGTLGGAIGGQALGANIGQGIADGRGVSIDGGPIGSLSNAAGVNMSPQNFTQAPTQTNTVSQQLSEPVTGYKSSFGDYGSHNTKFIGNPIRAAKAFQ